MCVVPVSPKRSVFSQILSFYHLLEFNLVLTVNNWSPGLCGLVGWASSCKRKGHQLIPGKGTCLVAIQVPGWGCARGNWFMFLWHIGVSLPSSFPKNKQIKSLLKKDWKISLEYPTLSEILNNLEFILTFYSLLCVIRIL